MSRQKRRMSGASSLVIAIVTLNHSIDLNDLNFCITSYVKFVCEHGGSTADAEDDRLFYAGSLGEEGLPL